MAAVVRLKTKLPYPKDASVVLATPEGGKHEGKVVKSGFRDTKHGYTFTTVCIEGITHASELGQKVKIRVRADEYCDVIGDDYISPGSIDYEGLVSEEEQKVKKRIERAGRRRRGRNG